MKNKQIFITKKVYQKIDIKNTTLYNAKIIKNTKAFWEREIKHPKEPIFLYDLGFNLKNTIVPINNHINKTGINILREESQKKINFYDITNIYTPNPKGRTAECFGDNKPIFKNSQYIQTYNLCNHVILAHRCGAKKIYAFVIN